MLTQPIKPMLLTQQKEDFLLNENANFTWEIKSDGWRLILVKQAGLVEAYTRHGNRVTDKFPELKEAGEAIKSDNAIIDCEGICLRDGRSVFDDFSFRGRLTNAVKIKTAAKTHPATFMAFDLISSSKDHTGESLVFRKKRLKEILNPSDVIFPTPSFEDGASLFQLTKEKNMEGIVGKKKDSRYELNKRSQDWVKIKHFKFIDTVIMGYKECPFQLIVGTYFPSMNHPKHIATVEFGFKPEEKNAFRQIAKQLHTRVDKGVQWLQPQLSCRISYLEKTENHKLRITSFKGFMFDKHPEDCIWYL